MQLSFTLNNVPLLLDENASVRLIWHNPFFTFREFPGNKGVGIEITGNSHNRAILGNPESFDKQRTGADREFPGFEIEFGGWQAMSGTLIIQNATAKTYSGWLRTAAGNIGKEERERNIYENPKFSLLKQFSNKAAYNPATDDYCCPTVINRRFFEDVGKKIDDNGEEVSLLAYNFNRTAGSVINIRNTDGTIKAIADNANVIDHPKELDVYVVTPMLFVNTVLKSLFNNSGFFIDNNYLAVNWLFNNLCIYNNYDITGMILGESSGWITYDWFDVDTQKATAKEFNSISRYYTGYFKYAQLLPAVSFKDFLLSLQNLSNTCTHFKAQNKIDILDREAILSGTADDLSEYMVDVWEIGEQKDITLKFTFEPDNSDNIISERFKNLDDRRNDIGEPVDNWADLQSIASPEFGEIRYIKNYRVYAEYRWVQKIETDDAGEEVTTDMLGWEHISLDFQNGFYNYGKDEVEEIPTKLSPFPKNVTVEQRGNMGSMKYESNDFALRLASNVGELFGGLQWEGDTGIIATRWPLTAKFLSSRLAVNGKAQLPVNVLDWVVRRMPYKKRTTDGEFIIEEMSVELSANTIAPVEFKGYKV